MNRASLPKYVSCKDTARLHEFVDIGVPGTVSTRRAACHQCDKCWQGERRSCTNLGYVGEPEERMFRREAMPVTSLSRVTRPQLERAAVARSSIAALDSTVCLETARGEHTHPWVLGKIIQVMHKPSAEQIVADTTARAAAKLADRLQLDQPRVDQEALKLQLWEPLQPGSSTYTLSNIVVLVPARRVRVADIDLVAIPRPPPPAPPQREVAARRVTGTHPHRRPALDQANAPPTPPVRFKLSDEGHILDQGQSTERKTNGLLEIRAQMPTHDDVWEVEKVIQHRSYYRKDQWLVKWKGYPESHNTWEPWEHLLLDCCLEAKAAGRECTQTHEAQKEALQLKAGTGS